ncbi:hypothetical protein [Burkholderia pseudomallei]|uniref:hypothetical protein n=1 Tax=Burkholderia pseudomallei TaxID=28450 RepID=UPI000A1A2B9D|nr:hypothetical protein [Burkholderia pseudomallei]ARK42610.1 hypothetical protein BOC60_20220 [Burkholderia pseudomallei]
MAKWILDEENNLIYEDDDRHTIICNFPCTLKNESMRADALKIVMAPELLEFVIELVGDDYWSETKANKARKLLAKVAGY